MKRVKFLKDYPVYTKEDEAKNKANKAGSLHEGGYEKGETAKLNGALAGKLKLKKVVEIIKEDENVDYSTEIVKDCSKLCDNC